MRVLITGSRDWADGDAIADALMVQRARAGVPWSYVTVVHGGARGADTLAHLAASRLGMQTEVHPAAWDTRGRAAGIIRNSEMVKAGADVCLAFILDQSRGATHCANAAEKAGILTIRYERTSP